MEFNFLWICVVVIVAICAYYYLLRGGNEKIKKTFLINKKRFDPLLENLAKDQFNVDQWSDTIIDINDKALIKWWKSILQKNNGNVQTIKCSLTIDLKRWGIILERPSVILEKGNRYAEPASTALINNIQRIKPLLKGIEKGNIDKSAWSDVIVDINNQELIEIWEKVLNNPEAWIRILSSWGIAHDPCTEFTYIKGREQLYDLIDGGDMKVGFSYTVVNSCWILTDPSGEKSVIVKGNVKPKSE